MGLKFIKKKQAGNQPTSSALSDAQTRMDKDGNVEIVAKNFTMTTNQSSKLSKKEKTDTTDTTGTTESWTCWGCGRVSTTAICPVCGKKKTN